MAERKLLMKFDKYTALSYCFIHFSVEVLCFFILDSFFLKETMLKWGAFFMFDSIAFLTQPLLGMFFEKYRRFVPGRIGLLFLIAGGAFCLIFRKNTVAMLAGLAVLTLGNAITHIAGALSTARVSEGRMSESAIFVAGGSFGVVTGRMLAKTAVPVFLVFIPALVALYLAGTTDRRIRGRYRDTAFDFMKRPTEHAVVNDRPGPVIAVILALIVAARGFIGYGLPTGWNRLDVHTVLLFVFMGIGKMLGGILADRFGARTVGMASSLLALPILLVSNQLMWLSLIGISLFSMTMAITLGGLFSVCKDSPGLAFGITTIGLYVGSVPLFFVQMPSQTICNFLNVFLSILAAVGFYYCMNNNKKTKVQGRQ